MFRQLVRMGNGNFGDSKASRRRDCRCCDLVHASITFKRLAEETGLPEKSLHRMLGERGNPTMQNIGKILQAIQNDPGFVPQVKVSAA